MISRALAVAAHQLGVDAAGVLERLSGPLGEHARTAASELARCDASTQKRMRAEWAMLARAPVPAGIRSIDATWLEVSVKDLPPRARGAVAAGGNGGLIDVWLARWATASFVAMPVVAVAARLRTRDDAGALDSQAALRWLGRIGADQLAYAMGSTSEALSQAVRDAHARIRQPPRVGQLGPIRAAIERCQLHGGDPILVGATTAAPHLSPVVRRQMVTRMSRSIGAKLGQAFDAGAFTPLDRSPTWTALAAD